MKLGLILLLGLLLACSSAKESHNVKPSIREEIFGREFSNSEVVSVEILEMEHPLLGPVLNARKLTKEQEERFLKDFDSLEKQGLRKCFAKYLLRLNFVSDTLRLKCVVIWSRTEAMTFIISCQTKETSSKTF